MPSIMPYRNALLLIAAMQITHVVDFMILMPLGPQLMRLFSITPTQFSIAVSAYTFSAGISGLAIAMIADRFDRKRLLLVVYAGLAVATLACALAPSFAFLVLARVMAGAFGGVMASITYAIVGDLVPPAFRGRGTAIVGAAFPIASTFGVPFSLLIAQKLSWHAPFYTLAALCTGLWLAGFKLLPNVASHIANDAVHRHPLRTVWTALTHPNHRWAFALTSLITLSSFSVIPFIAPVLTQNGVIAESNLPIAYAVGGISTFFSIQFIGRMADKFGKRRVFAWANVAAMIAIISTTHAVPIALPIIIAQWVAFMVLTSARWTPALALITGSSTPQLRGSFLAVNTSIMQFSSALGTFIAGLILINQPDGHIAHYNWVGYFSVLIGLLAFYAVRKVSAVS